jgi:EAL domain-containing protein (putative c-di-GMP-specific phosphodiesterase class I)
MRFATPDGPVVSDDPVPGAASGWSLGWDGWPGLELPAPAAARSPAFSPASLGIALQPVVELAGGGVFYEETLARFDRSPTHSQRSALIAGLEAEGTIHRLDREVLARAIELLRQDPYVRLGVNLSCRTIDAAAFELVRTLVSAGSLASRLVLEVTETAPLGDPAALHRLIEQARASGCAVAFDDFGAGWFTLADVAEFRPDIVKLDGALFARWFASADASCLGGLATLARSLAIPLVAEHVESAEMADFARAQGIPYAQGFHFAEPRRHRRARAA